MTIRRLAPTSALQPFLKPFLSRPPPHTQKKGVIYISRIPPNMRPQKVRHLLSEYGEVGRVYLAAEDAAVRRGKRQSATNAVNSSSSQNNNKKKLAARAPKRFTEGWVEFEDKDDAKRVAAALNGQPVGGRPRSNHRHDLWCLKYLKGFKWDDLTEEVAAQNAARESRLAAEASAAARERDFYLSRVDEARGREAVRKRREAKAEREREGEEGGGGGRRGRRFCFCRSSFRCCCPRCCRCGCAEESDFQAEPRLQRRGRRRRRRRGGGGPGSEKEEGGGGLWGWGRRRRRRSSERQHARAHRGQGVRSSLGPFSFARNIKTCKQMNE